MRRMRVFVWLPTLIALSLLAALFITTPVHAQDEQPPEPEQAPAEAVVDSPPEEEIPAAELVPALESAAETLATGDPWYKVGTKTYHFLSGVLPNTCANLYPGDPYCFQSTTPITAAVDYITTSGLPSDGVIYVETGSYTSESIFVDAAITPVYAGFKGLIGTVVDNLPTVNYAGDLNIKGVGLGFNIKGFKMTGGSGISIQNSKGTIKIEDVEVRQTTSGPGIEIKNHNGAVLLNRVDAHDDLFCGASIDNSAGSAGVTITNSSFDENHTENMLFRGGLIITTKGAIKIHGISASRNLNNKSGLWIARSGSITIEDSIFNNNARAIANDDFTPPTASIILNNVYAQNNNAGILLFTKGNITLTGVHSEKNIDGGAFDTCYVNGTPACTWLGSGVVTIIESTFDTNTGYGLNVTARGAITLTNVSVSGNTGNGAYLDTSWSQLASAVTINNDAFNSNGGDGLMILAKGAVNMNKVHAGDYDSYTGSPRGNAGGFGAYINNTFGTAGVTIKGATFGDNQFWYNGMTGLYIESRGTISAAFIEASENDWNGAVLDNSPGKGSIVLSGSNYANKFERNGTSAGYMGLMILSKGSVLLDGIYANDNSSSGLSYSSPSNTNSTTIKNGIFMGNETNLQIATSGTIALSNVNALYGSAGAGINLDNHFAAVPKSVTLSGCASENNAGNGISILSVGAIKLTTVTSSNNDLDGINIKNSDAVTPQAVTLNSITASSNFQNGLKILTKGAISITDAVTESNQQYGMILSDYGAGILPSKVTVSIANINYNGISGGYDNLRVMTNGSVSISDVLVIGCYSNCRGIVLGDTATDTPIGGSVTINNADVNNHPLNGLWVRAKGNIVISRLEAWENNLNGAFLSNIEGAPATPTVSVTNSQFYDNATYGLVIYAAGTVTVTNIDASTNYAGNGAFITNNSGNVSVLSTGGFINKFTNNYGYEGLQINTGGAVTLNKVEAIGNPDGDGVRIYHDSGFAGNVAINTGKFNDNGGHGLSVDSGGTITISNIEANGSINDYSGIYLINTYDTTGTKGITVQKSSFIGNKAGGLDVRSMGVITINAITAMHNATFGVSLDNFFSTPSGVNILSTLGANTFNFNGVNGLTVQTKGNIVANTITADHNGLKGAALFSTAGTVTVKGITTRYNADAGLDISAANTVTLSGMNSIMNRFGLFVTNMGHKVAISNSVVVGNREQGIFLVLLPGGSYTLNSTYYFGNDTDDMGVGNLEVH